MFKSKKRYLAYVLALMLAVILSLSACGQDASKNVLRVGVDDTSPPMEFRDESGKIQGYDIDFANEIGKRLNMKIEFVSTAWSGIFTALQSGKFDCIISSVSITDERKKNMAFSRSYIANSQIIVVSPNNTTINAVKDLKGKIVGVQIGTTAEEGCNKIMKDYPFKDFKKYEVVLEPFADLKTGRIDAIVVDEAVARYQISKNQGSFKVVGEKLTYEPIGIAFQLSKTDLRDKVDKVIDDMIKDGALKAISEKWFGEDMTKNLQQ